MSQHPMPVVMCSSLTEEGSETAFKALEYGAIDIIQKPKMGVKQFIEESKILICDAVKAAALAHRKKISPVPFHVPPKLSADAVLEKVISKSMIQTTEKVVSVGASTGGTEALKEFLEAMPEDAPGIVIVQHMPEIFTEAFAQRLNSLCEIEVVEAKNNDRVTLVCDPKDYPSVLQKLKAGSLDQTVRSHLAIKGFRLTSHYDQAIANYLEGKGAESLTLYPVQSLRYGENPHQSAALLSYTEGGTPLGGQVLHGKELSYNNMLDLDAAWRAVVSFKNNSIVIVKHLSPCGMASADDQLKAYQDALASDP